MKALARHGRAVTFLSRFDVDEELRAGTLVWRPLSGQTVPNHLQLVQPRSRPVNAPADMLARAIAATIHEELLQG